MLDSCRQQHTKAYELCTAGEAEGEAASAATDVASTGTRGLVLRKGNATLQPHVNDMRLTGLGLKVAQHPKVAANAAFRAPGSGGTCIASEATGAAASSGSRTRRSTSPSAYGSPVAESDGADIAGDMSSHPLEPQAPRGFQQPVITQHRPIDLTLQQAARLIELDGVSVRQPAKQGQPVHLQQPHAVLQQEQQIQHQLLQPPDQRHLRSNNVPGQPFLHRGPPHVGDLAGAPHGPMFLPIHGNLQRRLSDPFKWRREVYRADTTGPAFDAAHIQTMQTQMQPARTEPRNNPHELLYQQQQQAFFRRMRQQQQRQQFVQRKQHRPAQLAEAGCWISLKSDWTGSQHKHQKLPEISIHGMGHRANITIAA